MHSPQPNKLLICNQLIHYYFAHYYPMHSLDAVCFHCGLLLPDSYPQFNMKNLKLLGESPVDNLGIH